MVFVCLLSRGLEPQTVSQQDGMSATPSSSVTPRPPRVSLCVVSFSPLRSSIYLSVHCSTWQRWRTDTRSANRGKAKRQLEKIEIETRQPHQVGTPPGTVSSSQIFHCCTMQSLNFTSTFWIPFSMQKLNTCNPKFQREKQNGNSQVHLLRIQSSGLTLTQGGRFQQRWVLSDIYNPWDHSIGGCMKVSIKAALFLCREKKHPGKSSNCK